MALAFESQQVCVCCWGVGGVLNICFLVGKGVYGGFGAEKKMCECCHVQKVESSSVCV